MYDLSSRNQEIMRGNIVLRFGLDFTTTLRFTADYTSTVPLDVNELVALIWLDLCVPLYNFEHIPKRDCPPAVWFLSESGYTAHNTLRIYWFCAAHKVMLPNELPTLDPARLGFRIGSEIRLTRESAIVDLSHLAVRITIPLDSFSIIAISSLIRSSVIINLCPT